MPEKEVIVENLVKTFGKVVALNGVSFEVEKGEFFAIIGPSGCGKTTLLKCLIGLERPDSGTIYIEGRNVINTPIHERNVGLIFQNFGLFPHMTVFDNIAFGLKIKKYSEDKIKKEVDEVMRIVGLEGLGDRMPKELSVGQQQRVALARSIVVRPNILLYDEPLGNVEYSLQRKMLMEIKQIHRKVGFTSIYVTHDQEQAMSLADKIMVMNQGMIEQIGSPNDVYFNPKSIFVAKFVGEVNMLKGKVKSLIEDSAIVETSVGEFEAKLRGRRIQAEKVAYAIRPERMIIGDSAKNCHNKLEAEIVESVYKGSDVNYIVKLQDHSLFKISLQGEVLKEKKLEGKVLIGWNSEDAILLDKPSIIPQIDIEKAILGA